MYLTVNTLQSPDEIQLVSKWGDFVIDGYLYLRGSELIIAFQSSLVIQQSPEKSEQKNYHDEFKIP